MRLRSRLLTLSYLLLAYCVRGTQGIPTAEADASSLRTVPFSSGEAA